MAGYDKETAPHYRESRAKLKSVVFYTQKEVSDAMRILAIKENSTLQALCNEALMDLLAKYDVKIPKPKKEAKEA